MRAYGGTRRSASSTPRSPRSRQSTAGRGAGVGTGCGSASPKSPSVTRPARGTSARLGVRQNGATSQRRYLTKLQQARRLHRLRHSASPIHGGDASELIISKVPDQIGRLPLPLVSEQALAAITARKTSFVLRGPVETDTATEPRGGTR